MNDVNWWLMVLAFVLGLLLTFAFMIRRVTREVPVYGPLGRGPGVNVGTRDPGTGDIEIADTEPFGAGSVRLAEASRTGPPGYTIKGNEDSMLYHTTESPSYDATIAEVWFSEPADAERAGFQRWSAAAKVADVPPGPYGAGSAKAGPGGTGPAGWLVKGNEDSMLYHTTESPSYQQTIAELWFVDEETAVKAGFERWDKNQTK